MLRTPPPSHRPRTPPTRPASTTFTTFPLSLVRPSAVATILAEDYAASQAAPHAAPSYTLYLLNPSAGGTYAYSYDAA